MDLTNRWRAVRERQSPRMSLRAASKELGIGKSMLSQIELGRAHTTSRVIARACRVYSCQPNDLYEPREAGTVESGH